MKKKVVASPFVLQEISKIQTIQQYRAMLASSHGTVKAIGKKISDNRHPPMTRIGHLFKDPYPCVGDLEY